MFTGASAPTGSATDQLIALAQAIQDPNFKAKIADLTAREQAANDAEVKAQAVIDAATALQAQIVSRETAVSAREGAADGIDRKQAKAKAYLDSRDADLTQRETALASGVKGLADQTAALQTAQAKAESDANTRIANAQAALDARAAAVKATEDAAANALIAANDLKAKYSGLLAQISKLSAGAA